MLEAFTLHGIDPCVYVDHHEVHVFLSASPGTHPDHVTSFGSWARTGDLAGVTQEWPVLAFSVLGVDQDLLGPIADALDGIADLIERGNGGDRQVLIHDTNHDLHEVTGEIVATAALSIHCSYIAIETSPRANCSSPCQEEDTER